MQDLDSLRTFDAPDGGRLTEAMLAGLRAVFWGAAQPTIGFCGGLQMMAQTFGVQVDGIDLTQTGNMDNDSWRERTHEWGFTSVRQTGAHPLFTGLGSEMSFFEAHYWEVKAVPAGFQIFAETDISPIQLLAHDSLPLFGTQFHPEMSQDGNDLIEKFCSL